MALRPFTRACLRGRNPKDKDKYKDSRAHTHPDPRCEAHCASGRTRSRSRVSHSRTAHCCDHKPLIGMLDPTPEDGRLADAVNLPVGLDIEIKLP